MSTEQFQLNEAKGPFLVQPGSFRIKLLHSATRYVTSCTSTCARAHTHTSERAAGAKTTFYHSFLLPSPRTTDQHYELEKDKKELRSTSQ